MKTNGFTLIELLAVIILLGIIGLITVPVVNNSIEKSKQKARTMQIKEIEKAAKSWVANNLGMISETEETYVSVQTLIDEGYISSDSVVDPVEPKKNLDECVKISYLEKYSNYDFEYTNCVE